MKRSRMKLIGSYFKEKWHMLVLLITFMFIYWFVAYLYKVPSEAYTYSQQMVIFIAICYLLIDYIGFVKKYNKLLDIYENFNISLESMPKAKHLHEELYQQIITRYYELDREKIIKQKAAMEEMNDYYTLWAHQIKTPIAAMNLLLKDRESLQENGNQLELELFRTEQYVEMVLQYLRLESIASDMILKSYPLCPIVKKSIKKYAKSFINKKISLDFETFETGVITDEKWLGFVIEQILSNSLKYTKVGGEVKIRFIDGKTKQLIISDNGIGIHEEDIPRIFDRGFTGFNGRMDKRSTGIGLYLCKKVMQQLSHKLVVQSKVGEGTTIIIEFLEEIK